MKTAPEPAFVYDDGIAAVCRELLSPLAQGRGFKSRKSTMKLAVVIERGDDGYFVAHSPSLKSCWSQGRTRDEALANLREAIELYLEPDPSEIVAGEEREVVELTL